MDKLKIFIKKEIVLVISMLLAAVSCFFVCPDSLYFSYIDYRTLVILLSLMITMAGFQKQNVFKQIGEFLVNKMSSSRGVIIIFVALCFISSMFITNDVALLTFVPFSIITLTIADRKDLFINTIVLETIAANLGSMLTPLGNPQNLYLYSLSNMTIGEFIMLMLPYSIAAAIVLFVFCILCIDKKDISLTEKTTYSRTAHDRNLILMYSVSFLLSILVVAHIIPYKAGLMIILAAVLIFDREIILKPDYSLILTFVFLFIFIGNIKRIPALNDMLHSIVNSHEISTSIILSQFISNVPAAILCSGFTSDISKLIIGTNVGGLGTLIASMASLISFKQYVKTKNADAKKYITVFTVYNIVFLLVMITIVFLFHNTYI